MWYNRKYMSKEQGFLSKLLYGNIADQTQNRNGSVGSAGGDSPLIGVIPPSITNEDRIHPDTAMSLGVVFRSVDIITTSVSQLELGVYRSGIEIVAPTLIKNPNVNEPVSAFVQETVYSLALYGNAYWLLYGGDYTKGYPTDVQSIEVLDPDSVSITTDNNGKKEYWVGGTQVDSRRIKHLKHTRKPGNLVGYGPIQFCKEEIRAALMLRSFQNQWFDTRTVPAGVLTTDMDLNAEESKRFAEAWSAFLRDNAGIAVLPRGLSFQPLNLKPAEAQFLEVQSANDKNIARIFGIPAINLSVEMNGTSMTYMNLEQSNILFIQNTLTRYMNEIENNLSDLLPRGQRVQFKEEGLLRSDTATKWNIYKTQVEIGYTDGTELRQAEGKAPLTATSQPKANPVTEGEQ